MPLFLESSRCRLFGQEGTPHWDRRSALPLHTRGSCSGRKREKEFQGKRELQDEREGKISMKGKERKMWQGGKRKGGMEGRKEEEVEGREGGEWENSVSNTVCIGNSTINLNYY